MAMNMAFGVPGVSEDHPRWRVKGGKGREAGFLHGQIRPGCYGKNKTIWRSIG
jgi:hypothetical protein